MLHKEAIRKPQKLFPFLKMVEKRDSVPIPFKAAIPLCKMYICFLLYNFRYIPLSKAKHRFHIDGLNSVKYKLISKTAEPLYTHLLIDVGPPPIGARG